MLRNDYYLLSHIKLGRYMLVPLPRNLNTGSNPTPAGLKTNWWMELCLATLKDSFLPVNFHHILVYSIESFSLIIFFFCNQRLLVCRCLMATLIISLTTNNASELTTSGHTSRSHFVLEKMNGSCLLRCSLACYTWRLWPRFEMYSRIFIFLFETRIKQSKITPKITVCYVK